MKNRHEHALIAQLKEKRIDYIGFIVLGLADAIVEITGVHAGFLGVTGSTLIAGVAGVIVGFSAAISMGSASYLQAKQNVGKSALFPDSSPGRHTFVPSSCLRSLFFDPHDAPRVHHFHVGRYPARCRFTFYGAIVFDRNSGVSSLKRSV